MAWLSTQAPPLRGSAGQATACGGCSCQPPAAVGSNRLRRLRNRLRRLRSRLRRLRCRLRRQNLQTAISQPKMPETGNLSEDAHRKISKKKVFWFLGFIDAISGPNSIFFFFGTAWDCLGLLGTAWDWAWDWLETAINPKREGFYRKDVSKIAREWDSIHVGRKCF